MARLKGSKDNKKRVRIKNAYKGIIKINKYLYIYMPSHPNSMHGKRYIALHRLVAEWNIKRHLIKGEVAHHINGNTFDNSPENIEVLGYREHDKMSASKKERNINGKFK